MAELARCVWRRNYTQVEFFFILSRLADVGGLDVRKLNGKVLVFGPLSSSSGYYSSINRVRR